MEVSMAADLEVETLDHLGLIAGVIDELGLVELTDGLLPEHAQNCVSSGQVVKAMILNCLGFVSAPLYLFSEFFASKPVSHLLGEGVLASHLNDDRIGRVLDGLYASGTTMFFLKAALQAVQRFGVETTQLHLDSSSFAVTGEYVVPAAVAVVPAATEDGPPGDDIQPITICRGYSRDHRPDLKQYMLNLVCSQDGGVPLWLKVASGNQSDAQTFAGVITEFTSQWDLDALFVIDAAFYSEPNLQQVSSLRWLSRVPQTLTAAKDLIQASTDALTAVDCPLKDYKMWETTANYGGVEQRWILIESQTRKADADLWAKEVERLERRLNRELKQLQKTVFACRPDACEALIQFQAQLEKHQLVKLRIAPVQTKHKPGTPRTEKRDTTFIGYRIYATLELKPEAAAEFACQRSRFILATNQLDAQKWPASKLLQEYKQQQKVERGFRFLKDPLFFTSSVFVKKAQRVEALALIMALTLLVYTLAERKIRQGLASTEQTVLDQRQRPSDNPTFRWILQKFQGIHLVTLNGLQQITNLSVERQLIIRLLGPPTCRYYLLPELSPTCGM
jgi:transposase